MKFSASKKSQTKMTTWKKTGGWITGLRWAGWLRNAEWLAEKLGEIFEGEGVEEEPEQKAGEQFSADSVSPLDPGGDQS